MPDPYLYPQSSVLKNKLNLKEQGDLNDAEADFVSLRLKELAKEPLPGTYDMIHYQMMHQYIFQDLYGWAGTFRTINIEKEEPALGGLSIEYSTVQNLEKDPGRALKHMTTAGWTGLTLEDFTQKFSAVLAAIWKVHPFREGNTRTTITFCCQYIEEQGFSVNQKVFEENSAYVRTALVAYTAFFRDLGDLSKKEYLERIVYDIFSKSF